MKSTSLAVGLCSLALGAQAALYFERVGMLLFARRTRKDNKIVTCVFKQMKIYVSSVFGLGLLFATQAYATVYNSTTDFSTVNGNPNGVWSYGTEPVGFGVFSLMSYVVSGLNGSPQWTSNNGGDYTPGILVNLGGASQGTELGQLALHPGPGGEPAVLRWTAPSSGQAHISGQFFPGNIGIMLVGIRLDDAFIWSASDAGVFDLTKKIIQGDTIDFAVYGGYGSGLTPLEAAINVTAVPEPSTMIAGALLLLPFGVSTLRNLRRKS